MNPSATIDEIEAIIDRTEAIRDKWRGHAGYARKLDIELHALNMLLFVTVARERALAS